LCDAATPWICAGVGARAAPAATTPWISMGRRSSPRLILGMQQQWQPCLPWPKWEGKGEAVRERGREGKSNESKDGSGVVLGRISASFGFGGFGFGCSFLPMVFRVQIPKTLRVWGRFSFVPADHRWGSKTKQPNNGPLRTLSIKLYHPHSIPLPHPFTHPSTAHADI
jgi:hypothetical protein